MSETLHTSEIDINFCSRPKPASYYHSPAVSKCSGSNSSPYFLLGYGQRPSNRSFGSGSDADRCFFRSTVILQESPSAEDRPLFLRSLHCCTIYTVGGPHVGYLVSHVSSYFPSAQDWILVRCLRGGQSTSSPCENFRRCASRCTQGKCLLLSSVLFAARNECKFVAISRNLPLCAPQDLEVAQTELSTYVPQARCRGLFGTEATASDALVGAPGIWRRLIST